MNAMNRAWTEKTMPRIHILQHVPFEGPGNIEKWAFTHGFEVDVTHMWEYLLLPRPEEYDWLIILGGPMNIHEEAAYPWLKHEKAFLQQAIVYDKTILGICLGAQLLADALGAKVYPNAQKEIGWFPVTWTSAAQEHRIFQGLPKNPLVFHWHGDTFDLPAGAVHLASTEGCTNQAFLHGDRIIGLQFHPETTPLSVKLLTEHCKSDCLEGPYVQSPAELFSTQTYFDTLEAMLNTLFNNLLQATLPSSEAEATL